MLPLLFNGSGCSTQNSWVLSDLRLQLILMADGKKRIMSPWLPTKTLELTRTIDFNLLSVVQWTFSCSYKAVHQKYFIFVILVAKFPATSTYTEITSNYHTSSQPVTWNSVCSMGLVVSTTHLYRFPHALTKHITVHSRSGCSGRGRINTFY